MHEIVVGNNNVSYHIISYNELNDHYTESINQRDSNKEEGFYFSPTKTLLRLGCHRTTSIGQFTCPDVNIAIMTEFDFDKRNGTFFIDLFVL